MQVINKILSLILFSLFLVCQTGCKKFIEVEAPYTSTTSANVFKDDATAAAVLTGIYAQWSSQSVDFYTPSFSTLYLYTGLSADELTLFNTGNTIYSPYYTNDILPSSVAYWNNLYTTIIAANATVDGLSNAASLTQGVKDQLLGEAKFIRAFCYFNLVNLYGDVPLTTTADHKVNAVLRRTSASEVYAQIIRDLRDAQGALSQHYLESNALTAYAAGSEQRVRPARWAATALLSRVYLYNKQWAEAEEASTQVIDQSDLFALSTLQDAFKMNRRETIWSLQPVLPAPFANTGEGYLFILPSTGPNSYPNELCLSKGLVQSFEDGDNRKNEWVQKVMVGTDTFYCPFKYRSGADISSTEEYIIVLRLAEQYLIRAEARAELKNFAGAQSDLNVIRSRAGLPDFQSTDKELLLQTIQHERRLELFTEGGHRWFDLKRTNNIDEIMQPVASEKGGTWNATDALYPIPQTEITLNPNLEQNPGY